MRNLRPKPAPAIAPAAVTQLTAMAILGIDERRYLEWLVPKAQGVVEIGRLRLVPLDEAMRVLRAHARESADPAPETASPNDADEITCVDDVLARLGRRRVEAAQ